MSLEPGKRHITWGFYQPMVHFWLFVTTTSCLTIILFLARAPATFTEDLPRMLNNLLPWLGVVAVLVGSLSLLCWIYLLWSDWSSQRSIAALLTLLIIIGVWSLLVGVGLRQSVESTWRWARYGMIAGVVVGGLSSGNKDRYQRTETFDRNTGKLLSVTPWSYVASIPFVPTLMMLVFLAMLGASIGAAAFGAKVLLNL